MHRSMEFLGSILGQGHSSFLQKSMHVVQTGEANLYTTVFSLRLPFDGQGTSPGCFSAFRPVPTGISFSPHHG